MGGTKAGHENCGCMKCFSGVHNSAAKTWHCGLPSRLFKRLVLLACCAEILSQQPLHFCQDFTLMPNMLSLDFGMQNDTADTLWGPPLSAWLLVVLRQMEVQPSSILKVHVL
jgi:hypothetical protein